MESPKKSVKVRFVKQELEQLIFALEARMRFFQARADEEREANRLDEARSLWDNYIWTQNLRAKLRVQYNTLVEEIV